MCTSKITTFSSCQRRFFFFLSIIIPSNIIFCARTGSGAAFVLTKSLRSALDSSRLPPRFVLGDLPWRCHTRGDGSVHWVLRRHKLTRKTPSREDMTKDVSLVGLVDFVLCFILKQKVQLFTVLLGWLLFNWVLILFICSHCCCCALQEYLTYTATIGGKEQPCYLVTENHSFSWL